MKLTKCLLGIFIFSSAIVFAQEKEGDEPLSEEAQKAALAKATQNPLAAMYSLPFQNNTSYNLAPHSRNQNVLNIQPVIPINLSENLNLISRIIIPVVTQPSPIEDENSTGLGDINYTAWLSPSKSSKIIYGVGSAIQLPTSTGREYGSGEFGIGPSLVALTIINKWVAGFVINNIWTFGDAEENKFLFQYFVNYNLPKAWYLVSGPIITANWNASKDQRWVVPFGAGMGKILKLGKQPINVSAHAYYNVERPDNYGNWQMRLQLQFLFPRGKK